MLWDSHPLALGATPRQVWSDGIVQLTTSPDAGGLGGKNKPEGLQQTPKTPNWDKEIEETLKWDGLPPLESDGTTKESGAVIFDNVSSIWVRGPDGKNIRQLFPIAGSVAARQGKNATVVMKGGKLHSICLEFCTLHDPMADPVDWIRRGLRRLNLHGGSISLVSLLGVTHYLAYIQQTGLHHLWLPSWIVAHWRRTINVRRCYTRRTQPPAISQLPWRRSDSDPRRRRSPFRLTRCPPCLPLWYLPCRRLADISRDITWHLNVFLHFQSPWSRSGRFPAKRGYFGARSFQRCGVYAWTTLWACQHFNTDCGLASLVHPPSGKGLGSKQQA